ncbi:hypothetical protein Tco_0457254, partial [Tanacetum coccineum]
KFETSSRIPSNLDDWNATLLQPLDLSVHNLYGFLNEMQFFIDLDFFQRNDE